MSHRVAVRPVIVLGVAVATACSRPDATRRDTSTDSTGAALGPVDSDAGWVAEVGRLLVVPADSNDAGVILFPQSPTAPLVASLPVTVISSSGETRAARAALVESDSAVCGEASTLRFVTPVPDEWSVALAGASMTSLTTDSIEGMTPADSARFVTSISRLASSVTPPGSRFTALPFVVLSGRTFDRHGRTIAMAHLRRRLPQEATPLEEHVFLVAERVADSSEPFSVVFSARSEGTEETADHYEALAVLSGRESLFLVLARDQEARSTYEVLERTNTAAWRTRWARTLSC